MRYSTIIEKLLKKEGAVVLEEYKKFAENRFRLWTLANNFSDKRELRELNQIFFNLEEYGLLLKLGEYTSLRMANDFLAQARERASCLTIRKLFLISSKKPVLPKPKPFGIRRQSKRKVVTF